MKKTIEATVNGTWCGMTHRGAQLSSSDYFPKSPTQVTVSWEEPDPKHECGKGGVCKVILKDGGWEVVDGWGEHILWVAHCPFCGEKLE
jgi:hypothetical protein